MNEAKPYETPMPIGGTTPRRKSYRLIKKKIAEAPFAVAQKKKTTMEESKLNGIDSDTKSKRVDSSIVVVDLAKRKKPKKANTCVVRKKSKEYVAETSKATEQGVLKYQQEIKKKVMNFCSIRVQTLKSVGADTTTKKGKIPARKVSSTIPEKRIEENPKGKQKREIVPKRAGVDSSVKWKIDFSRTTEDVLKETVTPEDVAQVKKLVKEEFEAEEVDYEDVEFLGIIRPDNGVDPSIISVSSGSSISYSSDNLSGYCNYGEL